jgi:hypothetical protein
MPERVAYVYSVREPPGATRPSVYCTYLRHMIVDSKPITVQVGHRTTGVLYWTAVGGLLGGSYDCLE